MKLELIATASFGLEAVVRREIENLDYKIIATEDGKVTYLGDERALVKSNLFLRAADRVLLKMGEFTAVTFEELFQQIKGLPWEEWIPPEGAFVVNGTSVKSKLHHIPSCQSIVKKAIIERLSSVYGIKEFEETGPKFDIKITILKDRVTVTIDTSGKGLHKRGYRQGSVEAPIKETLAAALVMLSFWNKDRVLVDPFCGSGTIAIEAAMIALNIPPGIGREFASEEWEGIGKEIWKEERRKAFEGILQHDLKIYASDIDPKAIEMAQENAAEAGVDQVINFKVADVIKLADQLDESGQSKLGQYKNGIIITNPPYGERIGDVQAIKEAYKGLKSFLEKRPDWSLFIITSDRNLESKIYGRPANRRRKLYNGRIETTFYQFHGEKA